MIFVLLAAFLAIEKASAVVIVRHDGHDEITPSLTNTHSIAGTICPIKSTANHYPYSPPIVPVDCMKRAPMHTTTIATLPALSNSRSYDPYPQATPIESESQGLGTSEPSPSSPQTTKLWGKLGSPHWPTSCVADSSVPTTAAQVFVCGTGVLPSIASHKLPTTYSSSQPTYPCNHPSTSSASVSRTAMFTPASSITAAPTISQALQGVPTHPMIIDPGRLPSSGAPTSTIHVAITASAGHPSSAESELEETTITSQVTSFLTKTLKLSSMTTQPSTHHSLPPWSTPSSGSIPVSWSATHSEQPFVYTSAIAADPRCPYPFPGVYCGEPKTIVVTETRSSETSMIRAPATETKESQNNPGRCPYPGTTC